VPDDAAAIKSLAQSRNRSSRAQQPLTGALRQLRLIRLRAQGTSEDFPSARDWPVAEGQFFNADDMKHYAARRRARPHRRPRPYFPDGGSPIGK
jgi:hypothetical protein